MGINTIPMLLVMLLIAYWSPDYGSYYLRRNGEIVRDNGMTVWLYTKPAVEIYAKRHRERVVFSRH